MSDDRPAVDRDALPPGDYFILHIEWDWSSSEAPGLPSDVGPFVTRDEAEQWAHLNIGSGTWEVWPLSWPYLRVAGTEDA